MNEQVSSSISVRAAQKLIIAIKKKIVMETPKLEKLKCRLFPKSFVPPLQTFVHKYLCFGKWRDTNSVKSNAFIAVVAA